ncbi:MAG: hypothetical protein M1370_09055 [Bacteroidetes bacterium]|nr:hypothetical protein [Bacteroidota bacterium]
MFERLVAAGKTMIMVTHDRDLAKRVTRTLIIADGEIAGQVLNGEADPRPRGAGQLAPDIEMPSSRRNLRLATANA